MFPPLSAIFKRYSTVWGMSYHHPEVYIGGNDMEHQRTRVFVHNRDVMLCEHQRSHRTMGIGLVQVDPTLQTVLPMVMTSGKAHETMGTGAKFRSSGFLNAQDVQPKVNELSLEVVKFPSVTPISVVHRVDIGSTKTQGKANRNERGRGWQ